MRASKVNIVAAAGLAGMVLVAGASAVRADTVNGNISALPTPSGSQVVIAVNPTDGNGNSSGGTLNYYSNQWFGQTFTTGSNADGYLLNSIAVLDQYEQSHGWASGNTVTLNVFQPTTGATSGPVLYTGTTTVSAAGANGKWVVYSLSAPPQLAPNTLYAYAMNSQGTNAYSAMGLTVGNGSSSTASQPGTGSATGQLATFRTSTGAFTTTPAYWTGAGWGSNPAAAQVSATNDPTDVFTDNAEFQIIGTPATTPIPEPATVGIFAAGAVALLILRRRKSA